ncbi:MAG: acetamidase/formamidase family protein [Chloroflexi bacterium]|nr:acetamidase/formamidase family protein [Chloroflexota bacterium]
MKSIELDRTKSLLEEPGKGHNRFHPDIEPVLEVEQGEEVVIETRSAADNQLSRNSTAQDLVNTSPNRAHPLTGPVYVKGAEPGDLLEIEFLDITPSDWAFTGVRPGRGYLKEGFESFLAIWDIENGFATSKQVPGVKIPGGPFMGVAAVSPSHAQFQAWSKREAHLLARGGAVRPPQAQEAVPSVDPIASEGLRTGPPRENGGNMDVKQMTRGAKLLLPVGMPGGLFSTGDAHYAQGDGEVCLQAIEMDATTTVRFRVIKDGTSLYRMRGPHLSHTTYAPPTPQRFTATIGMPIHEDGANASEDLNVACRNALLEMIEVLVSREFTPEQAYVICSVAVDLKISQVVDAPNFIVTAFLPEGIFDV